MKIGIDARLMGETGVGRYIRNLIAHLAALDRRNSYVVFVRDAHWRPPNERWTKRVVAVPWHSVAEQLLMPWLLWRERLDVVHIPYFTIPLFYPGRFIVTMHDLTILHVNTGNASTLPWPLYAARRMGYRLVLTVGLARAARIIAVSRATKQELVDHFHLDPAKIVVTYEGIDERLRRQGTGGRLMKDAYFLYVGNAYPHKNLETLLAAFGRLKRERLVLVGREDFFYRRLREAVRAQGLTERVTFWGEASDRELANLYRHAVALVFPSLMEGFGLPALEALSVGCPVIVSDIPVFREILGDHAVYFRSGDAADLARALDSIRNRPRPRLNHSTYSWRTLAARTLATYESCHRL